MLTLTRLQHRLHYNPNTGHFTVRAIHGKTAGSRAGCLYYFKGYRAIRVDGKIYTEHRLAFFYMTDEWPPKGMQIDHINRVRDDNRWANLRLATHADNLRNTGIRKSNTTGYRGVCSRPSGKFSAEISQNGLRVHLGTFVTAVDASAAFLIAARERDGKYHPTENIDGGTQS